VAPAAQLLSGLIRSSSGCRFDTVPDAEPKGCKARPRGRCAVESELLRVGVPDPVRELESFGTDSWQRQRTETLKRDLRDPGRAPARGRRGPPGAERAQDAQNKQTNKQKNAERPRDGGGERAW
jgi:hypothetical protein